MILERRLGASLLAQLLAGDDPRCFWTPAGQIENPAFKDARGAHGVLLAAARGVFMGEPAKSVNADEFRWTFSRLVHDGLTGVLVCGSPFVVGRDPRLAALPAILRYLSGRVPNAANLHRLMDLVTRSYPKLFVNALLFSSENSKPFLLLHDFGDPTHGLRSWSRWPLSRLFNKRRAAVITNPITGQMGLAIPFSTTQTERYVLLFALQADELSQLDRDFLAVLGSVAAVAPRSTFQRRISTYDRVDVKAVPVAPQLYYYGRAELRRRIEAMVATHGWQLKSATSYVQVLSGMGSPFGVMLLDGAALRDTTRMLQWFRHALPNVPVLYFASGCDEETEMLIDVRIPPTCSDDEVFAAINDIVHELPQRRRDYLEAIVHRLSAVLSSTGSFMQFARTVARALATHFGDWASVHLFDFEGELYHSEFPVREEPLLPEVPMAFLNGYAIMKTRVDDEFFAEVCEEVQSRQFLASVKPLSGAAFPLAHGGRLVGSIVLLSTSRELDETDFGALSHFAEATSQAFVSLQTRLQRKHRMDDSERVCAGAYRVDVHHAFEKASGAFRAYAADENTIVIEANSGHGRTFAATLDVKQHKLTYDATYFPVPLYIGASGPTPLLESVARDHVLGCIALDGPSVTLIYNEALARSLDSAAVVEVVQRGLREAEENPAALLTALSRDRIPFIAITFR